MLSNSMARQRRMSKTLTEDKIIDARKYNLIMGAVVLYGLDSSNIQPTCNSNRLRCSCDYRLHNVEKIR